FELVDVDGNPVSVHVEYSTDYDPQTRLGNWFGATGTPETATESLAVGVSSELAVAHSFTWNAFSDADDISPLRRQDIDTDGDGSDDTQILASASVFLRITPTDSEGDSGTPAVTSVFLLGNDPPAVTLEAFLPGAGGDVPVSFALADATRDASAVDVQFRTPDDPNWRAMALRLGNVSGLPTGTSVGPVAHVVVWDSRAASNENPTIPQGVGTMQVDDVEVRIQARDEPVNGTEHFSRWSPSQVLRIDNNTPPVAQVLSADRIAGGLVRVGFGLFDEEEDRANLLVEYRDLDEDIWRVASLSTGGAVTSNLETSSNSTAPAEHLLVWDAAHDGVLRADTQIRITPYDQFDSGLTLITPVITVTTGWMQRARFPVEGATGTSVVLHEGRIYQHASVLNGSAIDVNFAVYEPEQGIWRLLTSPVIDGFLDAESRLLSLNGTLYFWSATLFGTSTIQRYDEDGDVWFHVSEPGDQFDAALVPFENRLCRVGGRSFNFFSTPTLDSVECYDPVSDSYEDLPNLPVAQALHAAVVVDDDLYLLGGTLGAGASDAVSTMYRYRSETGTWDSLAPLPEASMRGSVVAVGRSIYYLGGVGVDEEVSKRAFVYSIDEDVWSSDIDLPFPRAGHGALLFGDKIFVSGGGDDSGGANAVFAHEYFPAVGRFSAPLPLALRDMSVVTVNDQIYVLGGVDTSGQSIDSVYRFDTFAGTWSIESPMTTERRGGTAAVVEDFIYVFGGTTSTGSGVVPCGFADSERYDLRTDTWSPIAPLPYSARDLSSFVVDGFIFVVGGQCGTGNYLNTVSRYDPLTDTWLSAAPVPIDGNPGGAVSANGFGYVLGGVGPGNASYDSVFRYDP
ncbi:MAG: kelch repeat-containing protein, partial [Myxococcota bacterium]